jgi:hypothetical protein
MALTQFSDSTSIIQGLPRFPGSTYSEAQVKAFFDKGDTDFKTFFNGTHLTELDALATLLNSIAPGAVSIYPDFTGRSTYDQTHDVGTFNYTVTHSLGAIPRKAVLYFSSQDTRYHLKVDVLYNALSDTYTYQCAGFIFDGSNPYYGFWDEDDIGGESLVGGNDYDLGFGIRVFFEYISVKLLLPTFTTTQVVIPFRVDQDDSQIHFNLKAEVYL